MTELKPKLLILGSSGFIGKLAVQTFQKNYDIFGFSRTIDPLIQASLLSSHFFPIDLLNRIDFEKTLLRIEPDYILNLATCRNDACLSDALKINTEFSAYLMENMFSLLPNLKKVVLVGSAAEYGNVEFLPVNETTAQNPRSPYGLSKSIQSSFFKYFSQKPQFKFCLARPFNIIHEDISPFMAIGSFIHKIRNVSYGGKISVGNLQIKRDFVSVNDFLKAIELIFEYGKAGEDYNIASNLSYSLSDVLAFLIKKSGKNIIVEEQESQDNLNVIFDSRGSYEKLKQTCHWEPSESVFEVLDKVLL